MYLKSVCSRTLITETHLAKMRESFSREPKKTARFRDYLNDFTFNTLVVVRLCLESNKFGNDAHFF